MAQAARRVVPDGQVWTTIDYGAGPLTMLVPARTIQLDSKISMKEISTAEMIEYMVLMDRVRERYFQLKTAHL